MIIANALQTDGADAARGSSDVEPGDHRLPAGSGDVPADQQRCNRFQAKTVFRVAIVFTISSPAACRLPELVARVVVFLFPSKVASVNGVPV